MIKRHKGTWIAMYICALVSLVLLCSASWFIISLETHPISNVDAEMDAYKIMDADTSGSFNVSHVIYNGKTYTLDQIKSEIVAAKKTELYGNGAVDISINWKLGYYNDGTTQIENPDEIGKVAGTHYCEIIDNVTGQVIEPKHRVVIGQDELSVSATLKNTYPLFVGKTVFYRATWTGVTATDDTYKTDNIEYEVKETDFEGTDQTASATTPADNDGASVKADSSDAHAVFLLKNNFKVSEAPKAQVTYTILTTCYSIEGTDTSKVKYYPTLNKGLEETKKAADEATANGASAAATTLVAMQSFTYGEITYTSNPNESKEELKYTHTISGTKTVVSNVTLILPYVKTTKFNGTEEAYKESDRAAINSSTTQTTAVDGFYEVTRNDSAFGDAKAMCVNLVTLQGILNNNGHIEICGIMGNPAPFCNIPQASTSGNHAALNMAKYTEGTGEYSSQINMVENANATLKVCGYISNGGGAMITADKGVITMPFVIYNYYGGTNTVGKYQKGGIIPFTMFDMPNIQVKLKCKGGAGGASIKGISSLFTDEISASVLGQTITINSRYNLTEFYIFGDSGSLGEGTLFDMYDTSGYAEFEYNPGQSDYTTNGYKPNKDTATKITLKGNTESGNIEMVINLGLKAKFGDFLWGVASGLLGVDDPTVVSFTEVRFPVSYKIELHLSGEVNEKGEVIAQKQYDFNSDFKFLPGSELYIENGAQVNVNKTEKGGGLLFYGAIDPTSTRYTGNGILKNYYSAIAAKTPAKCYINNASLKVNSGAAIGGEVTPKGANAVLEIVSGAVLSITEQEGNGTRSGISFSFTNTGTETQSARGLVKYGPNIPTDEEGKAPTLANKRYTSVENGSSYVWACDIKITINYYLDKGTLEGSTGANGVVTKTFNANSKDGLTLGASHLTKPTRPYYKFGADWYTDSGFKTVASGQTTYTDTTYNLYAQWTAIEYTIAYKYKSVGVDATLPSVTFEKFTVETNAVTLPTPTHETYTFTAWYADEGYSDSKRINSSISGKDLLGMVTITDTTNNIVTIYGEWTSITYTVIFSGGELHGGGTTANWSQSYSNFNGVTLPDPMSGEVWRTDPSKQYHFVGWYIGDTKVESLNTDMFTIVDDKPQSLTLTAKWVEKAYTINLKNQITPYSDIVFDGSTVYIDESQLNENSVLNNPSQLLAAYEDKARTYDKDATQENYFVGWTANSNGTTKVETIDFSNTSSITIYAVWTTKNTIQISNSSSGSGSLKSVKYSIFIADDTSGLNSKEYSYTAAMDKPLYIAPGYAFKIDNLNNITSSGSSAIKTTWQTAGGGYDYTSGNASVEKYTGTVNRSCLVEGTLITLADGTQKRIEDITADDMLLVFNHETGKFEARHITYVDHMGEAASNCRVLNLVFSDGTVLRIVGTHGVYDMTLNKYVYISEYNVSDFLGHIFYTAEYDGEKFVGGKLELVDAYVTEEFVRVYSPITVYEANCFANNLLTVTPLMDGVESLIDIFDFDENMIFDMDKKQAEVAENGLYTYEDFAEYYSREEFDYLISFIERESQFFKISLAKGRVEKEDIIKLFNFVLRS